MYVIQVTFRKWGHLTWSHLFLCFFTLLWVSIAEFLRRGLLESVCLSGWLLRWSCSTELVQELIIKLVVSWQKLALFFLYRQVYSVGIVTIRVRRDSLRRDRLDILQLPVSLLDVSFIYSYLSLLLQLVKTIKGYEMLSELKYDWRADLLRAGYLLRLLGWMMNLLAFLYVDVPRSMLRC